MHRADDHNAPEAAPQLALGANGSSAAWIAELTSSGKTGKCNINSRERFSFYSLLLVSQWLKHRRHKRLLPFNSPVLIHSTLLHLSTY